MKAIIPNSIFKNDEIRVVSPSKSMAILSDETKKIAKERLQRLGYKVTFSKNLYKFDKDYECASVKERVSDLHDAFLDTNVKCILTAIGGYNINQILPYINYEIIKKNPKIICGFSDITALLNAIYAKTGLITFYGPHFSSFGMINGFDYTEKYFTLALNNENYEVVPSKYYSDDEWYNDQENRKYFKNNDFKSINYGKAEGIILGGNLCTFNLLQGTEFMPNSADIILFLEDDSESGANFLQEFDRNIESLIQTPNFQNVRGIVIGRAQVESEMTVRKWEKMLMNKKQLANIPIVINANFGHTTPIFTFPIGGKCKILATDKKTEIKIILGDINEK